jgi:hypothetical protein
MTHTILPCILARCQTMESAHHQPLSPAILAIDTLPPLPPRKQQPTHITQRPPPISPVRHLGVSSTPPLRQDTSISRVCKRLHLSPEHPHQYSACSSPPPGDFIPRLPPLQLLRVEYVRSSPLIISIDASISGIGSGRIVESSATCRSSQRCATRSRGVSCPGWRRLGPGVSIRISPDECEGGRTLRRSRGGAHAGVVPGAAAEGGDPGGTEK